MRTMQDTPSNRRDLANLLDNVIELLTSSEVWLKGSLSRTRTGMVCHPANPKARKWCVTGAISMIASTAKDFQKFKERVGLVAIWATVARLLGSDQLTTWNDASSRSHEDMLAELTALRDKLRNEPPAAPMGTASL